MAKEGDQNTSYFYKCIKNRCNKNANNSICHKDRNIEVEKSKVKDEFVAYFQNIFNGSNQEIEEKKITLVINSKISDELAKQIVR